MMTQGTDSKPRSAGGRGAVLAVDDGEQPLADRRHHHGRELRPFERRRDRDDVVGAAAADLALVARIDPQRRS
jgi:hypothetical protein